MSPVSQLLEALREAGAKYEVGEYTYCAGCFCFVEVCDSEARPMRPGADSLWCAGRIARAALARYAERPALRDDAELVSGISVVLDTGGVRPADRRRLGAVIILDIVDSMLLGPREAAVSATPSRPTCETCGGVVGKRNAYGVPSLHIDCDPNGPREAGPARESDKVPREPGCQCDKEIGDSPCRVHGDEGEAGPAKATDVPAGGSTASPAKSAPCETCGDAGTVTEWVEAMPACLADCHACGGTGTPTTTGGTR